MVNAKQIKSKIKSVSNIKQITKALEVVATVKLQKAKAQTDSYKDFLMDFLKIVQVVQQKTDIFAATPVENNQKKELIIVVGTDRGLCGWLNNRLFKQVFTKYESAKHRPDTFIVGKKALEFFSRTDFPVVGQTNIKDAFEQEDLAELFTFLNKAIGDQQYKSIQIYFNYFENAIKQTPLHMQVMPLSKHTLKTFGEQINIDVNQFLTKKVETSDIILEPSLPALVEEIKSQFIQHMIYGSILRNKTGEFAARMIAMKNAKDNSTTMIKNLRLSYNKARQSAVTQEISEIMGAKMALEG